MAAIKGTDGGGGGGGGGGGTSRPTGRGATAAYDGDDTVPSGPSRWQRKRRFSTRRIPSGPRGWTVPTTAGAQAGPGRITKMRARRPQLPKVPRPQGAAQQGWVPGYERARAARFGLAVPQPELPELELPVYLPGLDELKDMPLASLEPDRLSWWEKFFWGKPTPESLESMDVLGQLAVNMFWRWGAEAMYQLPKLPERQAHAMAQSGGWVTFSLGGAGGAGTSPYEAAFLASLTGGEAAQENWNLAQSALEQYAATTPEEMTQYLREGEIGYTFGQHPERLAEFRADMAAGMTVEDAVEKHQAFWTELILNAIIDPANILPAQAMVAVWPGGVLVAKGFAKGLGSVLSRTVGRLPIGKWLTQISARTLQRQAVGKSLDAATEVILRLPGDEDALVGLNRILGGDTAGFDLLSESASATMRELVEEFQDDGIRSMPDLVERYVPSLADSWGDDAFQAIVRQKPEMLPYFIGEAVRARQAAELGIRAASERGALARTFDFMSSIMKEQWLGPNPAYMMGNLSDNTVKAVLMGHWINPFDLAADAKVTRYMAGYGSVLPQQVMEGFIADELGIETMSRTAQIPIPGVGKPAEIVDFYNRVLGIDIRSIFPAMGALAPERAPTMARAFELVESPGRMAGILDKANWASIVEAGRGFSGHVEQSARVQIFQSVFTKQIEGAARPRLVQSAVGAGLSDDIVALLGNSSRVRSPLDIIALSEEITTFDPVARLSALMPEGGTSSEVLDQVGRELDRLQRLFAGTDAEGVQRLAAQVDDLFGNAMTWADEVGHAANFERRLADWRADQLQAAVGNLLERGRTVSDGLLALTRNAIAEDPAMASSAWARYFDQKQQISRMVHEEASRIIREKLPGMGDEVDGLLRRFEDVASSRPVGSLNVEDWGAFGERLAELRGSVDESFELTWQALARNPTEDGLHTVEAAYDALYAHWEDVASDASIWRDGYLAQDRRGKLRITPERYQEKMDQIWSEGFAQARQVWDDVALALRPASVPVPQPGTALYFVPKEATTEQVETALGIMSQRSGLSVEELRRLWGQDVDTLNQVTLRTLGVEDYLERQDLQWEDLQRLGKFFQGHVSPEGEVRLTSISGMSHEGMTEELWNLTQREYDRGASLTYLPTEQQFMVRLNFDVDADDAMTMLQALKTNLGLPGDTEILYIAQRADQPDIERQVLRGTLDDIIGQVRMRIQEARDRPLVNLFAQEGEQWLPAFPGPEVQAGEFAPAPSFDQAKAWLEAGAITREQFDHYVQVMQERAQRDFIQDSTSHLADDLRERYFDVRGRLGQWREAAMGRLQEATESRRLAGVELAQAQRSLRDLAQQWAGEIQDASIAGSLEVRRILFDYSVNQNWEEVLKWFVPFHKWQLRNPIIWSQILTQKPWVFSKIHQYIRASEHWREEQALTGRFAGTFPVPQALAERFPAPAPGGIWGMDPRALFSLAGQVREPFLSPQEEELTGWRGALGTLGRAPEYLGMHPWPWIEFPLEQMGAYGNRPPWGVLGTPGRVVPQLRRTEERIAEARVPGSSWMMDYNVRRRIAELVAEGQATEEEAAEAQFNPDSELYQRALQETRQVQDFMSQWRTMVPFGVKWASPGERTMREFRAQAAGMPPERSAYLRSLQPGQRAYGRAMTAVEAPEQGEWQAKRDAIFARYEPMMQQLAPWHPRYSELEKAMWAEIDELGPAPEAYTERGYPVEGDRDAVLFELEQARPRAQDYTTEAGEIDWDAYSQATTQYEQAVPEMAARWGVDLSLNEYQAFRNRYLSPLELAWHIREKQLAGGWEEYGPLREVRYPETTGEIAPGIQAGWLPGTAPGQVELPSVEPTGIVEEAPEVMRPWVRQEVERRMAEGWGTGEIQAWLRGQALPYEERQRTLEERGYGPMAVREMVPDILRQRPWLATQGYGEEEWGGIYPWLEKQMPGMFPEATHADDLTNYYFDLMPAQRRQMEQFLGLGEDTDITEWAKSLPPEAMRMTLMALEGQMDNFRPPSGSERLAAERDMLRWSEGLDEWTDTMDKYFGDADSPKSRFWDYWYANKNYLDDQYQDDDIVQATLSKDVRGLLTADDFENALYEAALERLQRYFNPDEASRWQRYPDLVEQAETERAEFLERFGYGTKPEDDTPEEEQWWDDRTEYLQDHPVHTWFYYYDKYLKWWGDVDPHGVGAYRPAPPPMPTPVPTAQPAGGGKKKKGGGPEIPEPPTWP